jgi:hypothetical protein
MVLIPVLCPHCHSDQVIKGSKTKAGLAAAAMRKLTVAYYLRYISSLSIGFSQWSCASQSSVTTRKLKG